MAETYDPLTLQVILQQLPEIERRKKAAERLRGAQSQFQALEQKKGSPNYQPTQQGGLYPTVARYQKDYAGAANQLVGAIGGYMADREANKADTSLSDMRNQEIIGAVQGMGQQPEGAGPDVATDRTLRAYLGMLGGPEVGNIIGKNAHRSSQVIEKGTGELINMMSDGSAQRTGIYPDPKRQILTPEGEPIQVVDLGGSGAGSGQAVKFGIPDESNIATPSFNPNATPGATQATPAPEDEAERWYQAVESVETGGEKDPTNAVSSAGARGPMQLMPPTARELEKALGLPEGSTNTDPEANRKAGRLYLDQRMQARNGDRALALMDYNWGLRKVDGWLASGADPAKVPDKVRDYVQKVTQRATGGSPPSAASPASAPSGTRTIVTPTAAQKAGAAEAAKIAAQNAAAPQTAAAEAQVEGAKAGATAYAKNIEETRAAIPRMESAINTAIKDVDDLLNDKALDQIIGGSVAARVAEFPTAAKVYTAVMAGTPQADAMAKYSKVMADAFKNGFEALKGGGPVSDREGQAAQEAEIRAKQSQSPAEFRKAMADWKTHINAGLEAKRKFLRGEYGAPGGAAPAAARPALPQGFEWGE